MRYYSRPDGTLWSARRRLGLSRRALAERAGTTEQVIKLWEIYSIRPDRDTQAKILQVLGLPLEEVVDVDHV
ncbi:helix-turn-helix domain-containing protein [Thermogutta sp.]|uniref:helix-turn-helix domain-containing protein n=1 Tax=Thermogutta sp. TaxID=1962930 RepID=UPI00322096A8